MHAIKAVAGALSFALIFSANAFAEDEKASASRSDFQSETAPTQILPSQIEFKESGFGKHGKGTGPAAAEDKGIMFFDAYGKIGKGPHGTFLKWPPGFKSPIHAHTYDYFAVVLKGEMANYAEGAKAIPLPVRSYWFQPGKQRHVTECISKEPCEAFLVQVDGKFDAQFSDKK